MFNSPLPPIKCLFLESGEIVMGYHEQDKKGDHNLYDCKQCIVQVVEGNMEVSLADFMPFAKEYNFKFKDQKVITVFDAKPQLEQNYKVATGNNVVESKTLVGGQQRGQVKK